MSGMRKIYSIMLMYAMAGAINGGTSSRACFDELSDSEKAEIEKIRKKKLEEIKQKGLKKFTIKDIEIYALNLKNAERKVNNLLTLNTQDDATL